MAKFSIGKYDVTDSYGTTLKNITVYHEDTKSGKLTGTGSRLLRTVCYINLKPVRVYSLYKRKFYIKDRTVNFKKVAEKINRNRRVIK